MKRIEVKKSGPRWLTWLERIVYAGLVILVLLAIFA